MAPLAFVPSAITPAVESIVKAVRALLTTIAVGATRWCERQRLRQAVVGCRNAQRVEIGKALEDRAHGVACPLGDLDGRRHLRRLAQQGQERLDDQLLGPFASQPTSVDSRRLKGLYVWQVSVHTLGRRPSRRDQ